MRCHWIPDCQRCQDDAFAQKPSSSPACNRLIFFGWNARHQAARKQMFLGTMISASTGGHKIRRVRWKALLARLWKWLCLSCVCARRMQEKLSLTKGSTRYGIPEIRLWRGTTDSQSCRLWGTLNRHPHPLGTRNPPTRIRAGAGSEIF